MFMKNENKKLSNLKMFREKNWFFLPMLTLFTLASSQAFSESQAPALKVAAPAGVQKPATTIKADSSVPKQAVQPTTNPAGQQEISTAKQKEISHRAQISSAAKLAREAAKNREPYSIRKRVKDWDALLAKFQAQLKGQHNISVSRKTLAGKMIPMGQYQYAPQAASADPQKKVSSGFIVKPAAVAGTADNKTAQNSVALSPIVATVFQQILKSPTALESMFTFYQMAPWKSDVGVDRKFLAIPQQSIVEALLGVKCFYISLNKAGNVMSVEMATKHHKYVYAIE